MLSPALNYDFICYPLRAQYFDRLSSSLQSEVTNLFFSIEKGLMNGNDLKSFSTSQLKNLFNLRMKAIGWFLEDNHLMDLNGTIDQCYDAFDSLNQNSKMIYFVENLKYALRANRRLLNSFVEPAHTLGLSERIENDLKASFLEINYDQFITSIALGVPDEDVAQRIIDLVGASLLIEFSAISAGILIEKNIDLSEEKAIQLTSIISAAGQDYSAICYELGLFNRVKFTQPQIKFDNDFIIEQQHLADLGLNDLLEN
ncbi:MAG: hypothetical protein IPI23_10560 [Bacteroidetes bacterium]|nr:hypothetical protein [Bacteroidota bacterium]